MNTMSNVECSTKNKPRMTATPPAWHLRVAKRRHLYEATGANPIKLDSGNEPSGLRAIEGEMHFVAERHTFYYMIPFDYICMYNIINKSTYGQAHKHHVQYSIVSPAYASNISDRSNSLCKSCVAYSISCISTFLIASALRLLCYDTLREANGAPDLQNYPLV
jgi:hypothetical protein